MADTPGGPPANLPIDGGPSQRPQQGNDSMKNGARPVSAPSSPNTPEVQTMEGMIQAARQQVQQTPGAPAPRQAQKQKPQQPGPRPGALASSGEMNATKQQPNGLKSQKLTSNEKEKSTPSHSQNGKNKAAASPKETPKQNKGMQVPTASKATNSGKMVPIVLVIMAVIELGLAGALGYLFVRPAQQVAGTATTDQVKVLEDQLYALQLREQDIDENSSRITALEGATEEFVTEEEFAAGVSELQNVTEQISGDSDNDGLSDYAEIVVYGTDVDLADTDGDGFTDGEEVAGNYNPKGPGRAEGLEAGMAYITQLWDGDVETDVVEDAGFVLDLTEEGVLDGVWSFADETTTYDAVLTGEYTFQVTGDRLVGTATVETTSAEGVATQGTVELDGSVNRATGVIRLTIEFGTSYVPSILAGERVVATVLGDARAVDVEATGKTMEEGSADLMESLPEEIATPSSGSATEDQDPPAIP